MVPDLLCGQAAPAALRPAVDALDEVGYPATSRFQERHLEVREALEDPAEDHVGELAHLAKAMGQHKGLAAVSPYIVEVDPNAVLPGRAMHTQHGPQGLCRLIQGVEAGVAITDGEPGRW